MTSTPGVNGAVPGRGVAATCGAPAQGRWPRERRHGRGEDRLDLLWAAFTAESLPFEAACERLLRHLMQQLPLRGVRLSVSGLPSALLTGFSLGDEEACWTLSRGCTEAVPLCQEALRYGEQLIGWLSFHGPDGAAQDQARLRSRVQPLAQGLAQRLALVAQRQRFCHWAQGRVARSTLWVGASAALQSFERALERCARSRLPTLISCEFGTDPAAAALALHYARCGPGAPFIEIRAACPEGSPGEWFERARGGSLYVSGLEDLAPDCLAVLPRYLPSQLGLWTFAQTTSPCLWMASTTLPLDGLREQLHAPRDLIAELSVLQLHLPPLRERREDLPSLLRHALQGLGEGPVPAVRPDVLDRLAMHAWPENHLELMRLAAQLALQTRGREIHYGDLMQCAPQLAPDRRGGNRPSSALRTGSQGVPGAALPDAGAVAAMAAGRPALTAREAVQLPAGWQIPEAHTRDATSARPSPDATAPDAARAAVQAPRGLARAGGEEGACAEPSHAADLANDGALELTLARALRAGTVALDPLPRSLQRALAYLLARSREPLTLDALAAQACISASHLRALFRAHLQTSVKLLLQQLRVLDAQEQLLDRPELAITELALQAGFADLSHFQRCFRRWTGCSPREFRQAFAGR